MLDEYVIEVPGKVQYDVLSKPYVVNWMVTIRTLHRVNGCRHSKCLNKFIPFDTLEEAEAFQEEHGVSFRKCKLCFPDEGEKNR